MYKCTWYKCGFHSRAHPPLQFTETVGTQGYPLELWSGLKAFLKPLQASEWSFGPKKQLLISWGNQKSFLCVCLFCFAQMVLLQPSRDQWWIYVSSAGREKQLEEKEASTGSHGFNRLLTWMDTQPTLYDKMHSREQHFAEPSQLGRNGQS